MPFHLPGGGLVAFLAESLPSAKAQGPGRPGSRAGRVTRIRRVDVGGMLPAAAPK